VKSAVSRIKNCRGFVHTVLLLCGCLASTPPLYRADTLLSRVSSSGSVSSLADDPTVTHDTTLDLNMAVMADLVQEKMFDVNDERNGLYYRAGL